VAKRVNSGSDVNARCGALRPSRSGDVVILVVAVLLSFERPTAAQAAFDSRLVMFGVIGPGTFGDDEGWLGAGVVGGPASVSV
jgi:hypothetical protein